MSKRLKLALSGVLLLGVSGLVTVGTLAMFTDSQSVGANAFSAGTIDLTATPSSALVTFSNMMPGDTVTDDLVLSNAGLESLRYSVTSTATNTDSKSLKDQLVLTVKTVDATTPSAPCDNFDGTQLYTGDVDSSAGKIVGDSATGQHGVAATGGDRTLAASASETLCFSVNMPSSTGNAFQGSATTATFVFDAEQTKNT